LTELPRPLAVIGAGPLGCELAQCFQRLGSRVTLITDGAAILPREDRDAAQIVHRQMEKDGVANHRRRPHSTREIRDGAKILTLTAADQQFAIACDAILVSVGARRMSKILIWKPRAFATRRAASRSTSGYAPPTGVSLPPGISASRYKFTHAADAMARIVIANALFFARRK